MHLVFLHGAPATGKHTVGCELAVLTAFRLYHNHLVVDEVLTRHAFGTPGFIAERDQIWREHLTQLPAAGSKDVIFTFTPEETVPQDFVDWLFQELPPRGVTLHSIRLVAREAAIERRLGSESRRSFRKLVDFDLYRRLRAAGAFASPVIPRIDLTIDTGAHPPGASARLIVQHLGMSATCGATGY